jgi:hypothetical protein
MALWGADSGAVGTACSNSFTYPFSVLVAGKSQVGGVRKGAGMPPLCDMSTSFDSFSMRSIEPKGSLASMGFKDGR